MYKTCTEYVWIIIVNSSPTVMSASEMTDEMAKDEARHGKGFEGLLKRYFSAELKQEEFNKKLEEIAKKLGLA